MDKVLEWAKELQSLAQAGLFYGHDVYDKERYQRIREIAAEMMLTRTDIPAEKIHGLFCNDVGYQTPKVDTRAAIFKDGKILLVKEKGQWSVPGGWCEFNLSPADNVVKETKEELPELAEHKCNKEQILMCFDAYQSDNWTVTFD